MLLKWFCLAFIVIVSMLLSTSCVNDMEVVNSISRVDTLPVETAREIEVLYSEFGNVQAMLLSPLMQRFEGKQPYIEFPEGIRVEFYDSLMNIKSSLTANYAISYEYSDVMEARNDVVVINNEKKEQINTEKLTWNQREHKIYSDVFVKITTADRTLYGDDGFESDENLDRWIIRKPRGSFELEEEEL